MGIRAEEEFPRPNIVLAVIFLAFCAGICFTGYQYYDGQRHGIESATESQLSTIADLKVQQVLAWRQDRIADALLLAADPLVAAPSSALGEFQLHNWLETFRKHNGYTQVAVLDQTGDVRSQALGHAMPADTRLLPFIAAALRTRDVAVSDFGEQAGSIYLDVLAPVPPGNDPPSGSVVLLRVEASAFLHAVQGWPTSSRTAECLLVRREANRVRYLTDLPHEKGTALHIARPLQSGDLPAAMAARGMEGVRYAIDYRGTPVLAAFRQVPDTPWALVAKMDTAEIYSPLRQRSLTIGAIVGLLLAACLTTLGLLWNLQRTKFYRRQHEAGLERQALAGRYAHLSRYVNDIVLLMDESGRIIEANDRAVTTYGYTLDELLRLSMRDLLDPSEYPSFDERWQYLKNQGADRFEGRHRRKDGSPMPVEVSSRDIELEGKVFSQSVIRDISERKRAESELRRVTRAMRVLSASNQALVRSENEAGLFRDICGAITDTGGYPLAWIGFAENDDRKSVRTVVASGHGVDYLDLHGIAWSVDNPRGRGPTGTCIRTGRIAVCNDLQTDPLFEPWREKARRYGYKSVIALPLYCEGAVIGALTIYASEPDAFHHEERDLLRELAGDVSYGIQSHRYRLERLRAEEALLQSAMEFQTLFDSASDAIFIVDLEGRILEVNQVACERLGYSKAELLSMTIQDIDSTNASRQAARLAKLVDCGRSLCETVHLGKNGAALPVEISSRIFDYRQAPAILSVAREIGERKEAEAEALRHAAELERAKTEAENASRVKSEFLANMSHEIRTPMNGILGMSGLLLDTSLTADQREYSETIRKSADALLAIVNGVLDLSKIEAGKIEIEPVRFDIIACLAETGELMAPQARAKGLEFLFIKPVEHCWVYGDAGRLRQIVLNLLGNAIKFTECGRISLEISSSESPDGGSVFTISAADTGIGIAAADLPLLFHKFTQIDSSLSKRHEGTGLGLAISRRLAELMDGTLTVASELGKGTTFVLTLPLHLAAEVDPVNPSGQLEEAPLTAKCRRVLVAEDNVVNQKIGVRLLEKYGCRVDLAANGREAVEMAARFPYDLIFMDCRMPEMDGYAATRAIRARQLEGAHIPIVALTAHAIAGTREECLAAGMDDYIAKPVSPAAMRQMLLKWSP